MTFIVIFDKNKHSTEFTHLFLHMCVCICMLSVGVCVHCVMHVKVRPLLPGRPRV